MNLLMFACLSLFAAAKLPNQGVSEESDFAPTLSVLLHTFLFCLIYKS
jgi:hypothetical protein